MKEVIYGVPPSKSNCYRIVTIHGHGAIKKLDKMKEWEESFFMQCTIRDEKIKKYFRLDLDVFFPSQRSDLDNVLKGVLDCLQAQGVIKNDRWCVEIHARKFIDKYRPRIEFEVTPIEI